MTCEACQSQLLEYVYEELGPAQKRETEAHLATCEACGRELAEIREALSLAREALPVEVPGEEGVASLLAYAEQQAARMKEARAPAKGGGGLLPKWLSQLVLRPGFGVAILVVVVAGLSIKLAGDVTRSSSNALAGRDEPPASAERKLSTERNLKDFASGASADRPESEPAARGWFASDEPSPAPVAAAPKVAPAGAAQRPMSPPSAKPAEPPAAVSPVVAAAPSDDGDLGVEQGRRVAAGAPTMLEEQLGARLEEAPRRKNEAPADGLLGGDRGGAAGLSDSFGTRGGDVGVGGLSGSGSIGAKGLGSGGGGTSAAPAKVASDRTSSPGAGTGRAAGATVDSLDRRPKLDADQPMSKDAALAKRLEEPAAKRDAAPDEGRVLEESRSFSKSRGDVATVAPERELAAAPATAAPAPPPPAPTAAAPRSFGPTGGAVAGAELDEDDVIGLGGVGTRDAKKRPVSAGKSAAGEARADEARARREAHAGAVSNAISEIEQAEALFREAQRLAAAERRAEAVALYLRVVDGYPTSDRARQSLYAAWLIEHERGATASATTLFARLERRFPGSGELAMAKARVSRDKGGRVDAEKKKESSRPASRSRVDFADESVEKSQAPVEMAPAEAAPPAEPVRAY